MKNRLVKMIVMICSVMMLFGCSFNERFFSASLKENENNNNNNEEDNNSPYKVFDNEDFKITLPREYEEYTRPLFTYYFENDEGEIVSVIKNEKNSASIIGTQKDETIDEYLDSIQKFKRSEEKFIYNDNYYYIEEIEDDFYNIEYAFETNDAFWLIDMSCNIKNNSRCKEQLYKWAEGIEIKNLE